jgi:hypothetical protein
MPRLSFFADENDAKVLLRWLDASKNILWIVPSDTGPWQTAAKLNPVQDGTYRLWHRSGGPPPIRMPGLAEMKLPPGEPLARYSKPQIARIWITARLKISPPCFVLDLHSRQRPYTPQERAKYQEAADKSFEALKRQYPEAFAHGETSIGLMDYPASLLEGAPEERLMGNKDCLAVSTFEWTPEYREPGDERAFRAAQDWWNGLNTWVRLHATPLGRFMAPEEEQGGRMTVKPWSFWAFPSALRKMKQGMPFEADGHSLAREIKAARVPER